MKTIFIPIALTMLILSALITSCGANKKMQSSSTTTPKTTKESVVTKPEEKNTTIVKKSNSTEAETITTTVPAVIKDKFNTVYSSATDVVWAKETPLVGTTNNATTTYKAIFVRDGKSNWIIYSENGEIIEERQQIKTDQLPQNVYNAIKQKYPDADIVLATTYKHVKQDGSYYALIVPLSGVEKKEIELILRENGSFVQ